MLGQATVPLSAIRAGDRFGDDLMEVATQDSVLELCGQLLEYIKAYKGLFLSLLLIAGETEAFIPTNGDDIWSFYKTVQTEYSALKKVRKCCISLT